MQRVLLGLQPLGMLESSDTDSLQWFDIGLNDSQQNAVRFALESPEVACIWGPPGTCV
jgi:DNA polymerase alpha-associated DNA helicase A